MPLNSAGLTLQATAIQGVLFYAQLHSGGAGAGGTDNIAIAGRRAVPWGAPGASFGLISQINFTGGTPGSAVHSVTLWSAETGGVCYGEFVLTGDLTFNAIGEFNVTAIDFTGTVSGS